MSKGKWPRGFSMSITTTKTQGTRVIVWRRNSDGAKRIKLMEHTLAPGHAFVFCPPIIGGKGNRRRVEVTINPTVWPDE